MTQCRSRPSHRSALADLLAFSGAVLAIVAWSPRAAADSGATDGESARAASLADAVVARPGDTSAIFLNPAGLADVERTTLTLHGHAAYSRFGWARPGESERVSERAIGGYGVSLVVPMPGPDWLRRFHLGAAVHVPTGGLIGVDASPREDAPTAPMYGTRLERTAATLSCGIALPGWVDIGIGATLAPTLIAPATITFDPRRGTSVDDGVVVRFDRDVPTGWGLLLGIRFAPTRELAVGLAFRQGVTLRAQGALELRAGSALLDDPLDFADFYSADEIAFGIAAFPIPGVSFSVDATWARWRAFRDAHARIPAQPLHDTVSLRAGFEWTERWASVRAGYAWEPTPVPPQVGASSFLDSDHHVFTAGFGADLSDVLSLPVTVELYARAHALGPIDVRKDASLLPDARPMLAGTQIDTLGYPGVRGEILYLQLGLSLTLRLGERTVIEERRVRR